jgi:hypothetical protein
MNHGLESFPSWVFSYHGSFIVLWMNNSIYSRLLPFVNPTVCYLILSRYSSFIFPGPFISRVCYFIPWGPKLYTYVLYNYSLLKYLPYVLDSSLLRVIFVMSFRVRDPKWQKVFYLMNLFVSWSNVMYRFLLLSYVARYRSVWVSLLLFIFFR